LGLFEVVELRQLGLSLGFEGVEAATQPIPKGAIGGVGGFQFFDEPVLAGGEVGDLVAQCSGSLGLGALTCTDTEPSLAVRVQSKRQPTRAQRARPGSPLTDPGRPVTT